MRFDFDMLLEDYRSGELFEKFEEVVGTDIYEDNYQRFDLINQLYSHELYKRAETLLDKGEYLDLDFYFNDIFVNVDLENYDLIQDLVTQAWEEVQTEIYFLENVLLKADKKVNMALRQIYYN